MKIFQNLYDKFTPYTSAKPFTANLPTWVTPEDQERINAYEVYEKIYRNVPNTFSLVMRGTNNRPVTLPTAKTLVEAINRFYAVKWSYAIDENFGNTSTNEELRSQLKSLFAREDFYSTLQATKRWSLIRGDALLHIVADDTRPEGNRISIYGVDPSTYFPITDMNDTSRIVGCHLLTQMKSDDGTTILRRHTYRKEEEGIFTQVKYFEMNGWDDRWGSSQEIKEVNPPAQMRDGQEELHKGFYLPKEITSIPIYHIKNNPEIENSFGVSEMAGFESVFMAINQVASDMELQLSLDGAGMYVTTSGSPVDPQTGDPIPWRLGPGGVVEIEPDTDFKRVTGISGKDLAGIEYINKIKQEVLEAAGVPEVAIGSSRTRAVESGTSIALRMHPILSKCAEKEVTFIGVIDQFLYDLCTMWLPYYEHTSSECRAYSIIGNPIPISREESIAELTTLLDAGVIDTEVFREKLTEYGYVFDGSIKNRILQEKAQMSEAESSGDSFRQNVDSLLTGEDYV